MRLKPAKKDVACSIFQSTHPKRDETDRSFRKWVSDVFQSTHPKRDETGPKKVVTFCKLFQSTHPKRDETFEEKHYRSKIDGFQSTHPKRDETRRKSKSEKRRPYFNPLIPNGMRLQDCVKNIYIIIFQSTHPKRDETVIIIYNPVFFNISIHSSQTGWD